MFDRHTAAIFGAVFLIALTASLSLVAVFYFPEYFILVYFSSLICALISVNRTEQPEYRLSKLALSVIFPIFAAPFCVLLRRRASIKEAEFFNTEGGFFDRNDALAYLSGDELALVRTVFSADRQAMISFDSECKYFSDGREMLDEMISDIRGAKKFVFLEYYIISEGAVWQRVLDELIALAANGVEVRVLFDDLGSMKTVPVEYAKKLCTLGINAKAFYPISGKMSVHNNRNHRKSLIIDGEVAYVGGINLSDEYAGITKPFGEWKDCGIRICKDAALGASVSFLSLWDFNCGARGENARYASEISLQRRTDSLFVSFSSVPRPFCRRNCAKEILMSVINRARRYIYITTPYLVPDFEIIEAFARAVARGVEAVIITPCVPDKKMMKIVTESFYPTLVSEGVKIYEFLPGFMHGKCVVSDDEIALVGSVNLDYRSLAHNFENGIIIYKHPSVMDVKRDFLCTLRRSEKIVNPTLSIKKKAARLAMGAILPIL